MKQILTFFTLLVLAVPEWLSAQNVQGGSQINLYFPVVSVECGSKIEITGNDLNNQLAPDDRVLIIQMKGAKIDHSNNASYGNVSGQNSAGLYEFTEILSVTGNHIELKYQLTNAYDLPHGKVQLVKIPKLTGAVINVTAGSGPLSCPPYNNNTGTGGVLVIEAVNSTLNLQQDINVDGKGFMNGGLNGHGSGLNCNPNYFFAASTNLGGYKGEGITDDVGVNDECGIGKLVNGGGGANDINCGGAGGSNVALGGFGGFGFQDINYNATPYSGNPNPFPDNAQPYCNTNRAVGGMALTFDNAHAFLGGGGGGGHQNDYLGGAGGLGGGIIIFRVKEVIGNGRTISANGLDGQSSTSTSPTGDGAGGGGGGGVIFIEETNGFGSAVLYLSARGGKGGNVVCYRPHGPGGGGSGGAIRTTTSLSGTSVTADASGGDRGYYYITSAGTAYQYGAEPGASVTPASGFAAVVSDMPLLSCCGNTGLNYYGIFNRMLEDPAAPANKNIVPVSVKTMPGQDEGWIIFAKEKRFWNYPTSISTDKKDDNSDRGLNKTTVGTEFETRYTQVYYLIRLSSCGAVLWTKKYDNLYEVNAKDMVIADNGFTLLFNQNYNPPIPIANRNGVHGEYTYVVHTDLSGVIQWHQVYGDNNTCGAGNWAISTLGNRMITSYDASNAFDGYLITGKGTRSCGTDKRDLMVMKIDPSGALLWRKFYEAPSGHAEIPSTHSIEGMDIIQSRPTKTSAPDVNIVLAKAGAFGDPADIFIMKLSLDGNTYSDEKLLGEYQNSASQDVKEAAEAIVQVYDQNQARDGYAVLANDRTAGGINVIRTDNSFNMSWNKKYAIAPGLYGNDILLHHTSGNFAGFVIPGFHKGNETEGDNQMLMIDVNGDNPVLKTYTDDNGVRWSINNGVYFTSYPYDQTDFVYSRFSDIDACNDEGYIMVLPQQKTGPTIVKTNNAGDAPCTYVKSVTQTSGLTDARPSIHLPLADNSNFQHATVYTPGINPYGFNVNECDNGSWTHGSLHTPGQFTGGSNPCAGLGQYQFNINFNLLGGDMSQVFADIGFNGPSTPTPLNYSWTADGVYIGNSASFTNLPLPYSPSEPDKPHEICLSIEIQPGCTVKRCTTVRYCNPVDYEILLNPSSMDPNGIGIDLDHTPLAGNFSYIWTINGQTASNSSSFFNFFDGSITHTYEICLKVVVHPGCTTQKCTTINICDFFPAPPFDAVLVNSMNTTFLFSFDYSYIPLPFVSTVWFNPGNGGPSVIVPVGAYSTSHSYGPSGIVYGTIQPCITIILTNGCVKTVCKTIHLSPPDAGFVAQNPDVTAADKESQVLGNNLRPALSVYPNPGSGVYECTVSGAAPDAAYTLEVYDNLGRKVYTREKKKEESRVTIDISGLANGVYHMKTTIGEQVLVQKLIKQ